MCGIVGIVHLDGKPVDQRILKRMTDALAHRGPDGDGHYIDRNVGLGHRRLAILDLSDAAAQPMTAADGRFVISYNGEVYNFRELRKELEALGHTFCSHSDTEVVLYAYMQWQEKCVERLNGMFALAIWDHTKRSLFIARDRYGMKPLYYARAGKALLIASEVKALLQHPSFRVSIDKTALVQYFTFQNYFTSQTLFRNVDILPAGTYAHVATDSPSISPVRYWDFNFEEPDNSISFQESSEELVRLFQRAVQRQLVSDVEIGSYLSGGMDSGSITAIAARELPYMRTFTCGFDLHSASGLELAFDEREAAEHMSYLFKTEHYEMVLKAGDMERVLPKLTWHLEEPRVGQSYPNYYAAQLASKFVKVALAGTGGDEIFGGYPWRYYRAVVNDNFDHYIDQYYAYWQRLLEDSTMPQVFRPIWQDVKDVSTRGIFRDIFGSNTADLDRPADYVNHSLYLEAKTFLHGLLVVEDKLSMAHSLETRIPFLDNDLVDFAMRVPVKYKLTNIDSPEVLDHNISGANSAAAKARLRDGKTILRQAMNSFIPAEVTDRKKQGFSAPDATWFKGESIDYVRDNLYTKSSPIYEYLDYNTICRVINSHLTGQHNYRLLIWSLLNFDCWCKTFRDTNAPCKRPVIGSLSASGTSERNPSFS